MEWIIWLVLFIVAVFVISHIRDKKRREKLLAKYGNHILVEKLMDQEVWQGQTEEQLLDSIAKPLDIDQKVLKTKTKETWKYDEKAKNRYALKVILENGLVVGWDKK